MDHSDGVLLLLESTFSCDIYSNDIRIKLSSHERHECHRGINFSIKREKVREVNQQQDLKLKAIIFLCYAKSFLSCKICPNHWLNLKCPLSGQINCTYIVLFHTSMVYVSIRMTENNNPTPIFQ